MSQRKSEKIYILELEDSKYYVGRTNDVQRRIEEHIKGIGSMWTKKHKVLKLLKVIENCNSFDEDKYVKMLMKEHGIANVRGGAYSQITLLPDQIKSIQNELLGATDICFNCGKEGHWLETKFNIIHNNNCEADINGYELKKYSSNSGVIFCLGCVSVPSISNK